MWFMVLKWAFVPPSHSCDLSIKAPGSARSVKLRLKIIAEYFGTSTNWSAAINSASLLPPPAAPPYNASRQSNMRKLACFGCGWWGIH